MAAGRCLCRIDPDTGEVRTVFKRSLARNFHRMTLGLRAIWLSAEEQHLGRPFLIGIDPITLQPDVESEPLEASVSFGVSVATAGRSVWLGFRHRLVEVDPHTGDVRDDLIRDATIDGLVSTGRNLWILDELERASSSSTRRTFPGRREWPRFVRTGNLGGSAGVQGTAQPAKPMARTRMLVAIALLLTAGSSSDPQKGATHPPEAPALPTADTGAIEIASLAGRFTFSAGTDFGNEEIYVADADGSGVIR